MWAAPLPKDLPICYAIINLPQLSWIELISYAVLYSTGTVKYNVTMSSTKAPTITVSVLDEDLSVVASSKTSAGVLQVENVNLWWPYTMSNKTYAYLYTLEVS